MVDGLWSQKSFSFSGERYTVTDAICEPKPVRKLMIYAGGESEGEKSMIAAQCDAYVRGKDGWRARGGRGDYELPPSPHAASASDPKDAIPKPATADTPSRGAADAGSIFSGNQFRCNLERLLSSHYATSLPRVKPS